MKRLKPEDLPEVLTDEILYTLAEMAEETAVSEDWIECSLKLTDEQKFLVYEKRSEVRKIKENERFESMTEEERQKEKENGNNGMRTLTPISSTVTWGSPRHLKNIITDMESGLPDMIIMGTKQKKINPNSHFH